MIKSSFPIYKYDILRPSYQHSTASDEFRWIEMQRIYTYVCSCKHNRLWINIYPYSHKYSYSHIYACVFSHNCNCNLWINMRSYLHHYGHDKSLFDFTANSHLWMNKHFWWKYFMAVNINASVICNWQYWSTCGLSFKPQPG